MQICTLLVALMLTGGCSGGGGGETTPTTQPSSQLANAAGDWAITEYMSSNTCGNEVSSTIPWDNYHVAVTQNDTVLTVSTNSGTYSGTITGNKFAWTGSYPNNGGTTTITTMTLAIAADGKSLSGAAKWSWSDGSSPCSGITNVKGSRANLPPTANAGPNQTSAVVWNTVTLNGSGSNDPESDPLTYSWTFSQRPNGSTATLQSPTTSAPTFVPDVAGTYIIGLIVNDGQAASLKDEVSVTAALSQGGATIPAAPTNAAASDITTATATLTWTDNSTNEDGFEVGTCTVAGDIIIIGASAAASAAACTMTVVDTVGAGVTSYAITGLTPGTGYIYAVRAYNSAGSSDLAQASFTTQTDLPLPAAPTDLGITSSTSSSVSLYWSNSATNETGIKIYAATSASGPFNVVAQVGPDTSIATVENLSPSTTYYFKVEAFNASGVSGFSNTANTTTPAAATPPSAPGDIVVMNITDSSARLTWTDNATNETGYQIGTCSGLVSVTGDGLRSCSSGFNLLSAQPANSTSYTFTGLSSATTYNNYFVRAVNSAGNSAAYGLGFTTLATATTVTFQTIFRNTMIDGSLDSSLANSVYHFNEIGVGCNWTYDWVVDYGYYQNFVCAMSAFDFDLSSLVGKTINSAVLTMEPKSLPLDRSRQYRLSAIATAWNTNTITWNWTAANLQWYSASVVNFYPPYTYQDVQFDVTGVVQDWADGSWNSYGFLLDIPNLLFPYGTYFQQASFFSPTLTVNYQ